MKIYQYILLLMEIIVLKNLKCLLKEHKILEYLKLSIMTEFMSENFRRFKIYYLLEVEDIGMETYFIASKTK